MIKQVQIFTAKTTEDLQKKINEFCVDFFPEEISSVTIREIVSTEQSDCWLGYVVYQKNEY